MGVAVKGATHCRRLPPCRMAGRTLAGIRRNVKELGLKSDAASDLTCPHEPPRYHYEPATDKIRLDCDHPEARESTALCWTSAVPLCTTRLHVSLEVCVRIGGFTMVTRMPSSQMCSDRTQDRLRKVK